jgi:hypothetical protein
MKNNRVVTVLKLPLELNNYMREEVKRLGTNKNAFITQMLWNYKENRK